MTTTTDLNQALQSLTNGLGFNSDFLNGIRTNLIQGSIGHIQGYYQVHRITGELMYQSRNEGTLHNVMRVLQDHIRTFNASIEEREFQTMARIVPDNHRALVNHLQSSIIEASNNVYEQGGHPTHAIMSNDNYMRLQHELGLGNNWTLNTPMGIATASGQLNVEASPYVSNDSVYVLPQGDYIRGRLGDHINVEASRSAVSDEIEVRLSNYSQLANTRPGDAGELEGLNDEINASINRIQDDLANQYFNDGGNYEGMAAWLPNTAPTNNFFGVDRTIAPRIVNDDIEVIPARKEREEGDYTL